MSTLQTLREPKAERLRSNLAQRVPVEIGFPQFPKHTSVTLLHLIPTRNKGGLYDSSMNYETISEEGLTWHPDGMLVVLMSGIPVVAEAEIEEKRSGVPLLYQKDVYTLGEIEVQALTGILTIRMVSE
jgi:hypothetical protein